jgi:outer membrane protein assembly factor BamB
VGDDERLYLPASGELLAFGHGGETRWRTDVGLTGAAAAVHEETLFVAGSGGEEGPGTVLAADAASGEPRWRRDGVVGGSTTAPPAAADGSVYVDGGRYLAALDAASGERRWRHEFGHGSIAALAVDGDLLSVATGTDNDGRPGGGRFGTLYGLATGGEEVSEFRFDSPVLDAAFDGRRAAVLVESGRVVVTETGDYPTGAARGVDLGWEPDADGRIETVGDDLYVANSAGELLGLGVPESTPAGRD